MTQETNQETGDGLIWEDEAENLKTQEELGDDYFTPEQGENDITFLDNGTVYRDQKKFDEQEMTYIKFRVEVDGTEMIWDMKKSESRDSKFGKIARYASHKDGLEDETITWFRQGEGTDTNHVLMDLSDLDDGSEEAVFDEDEESESDE